MPRLQPIQAIRYTTDGGDISTRIAPPYDVLDESSKQRLLTRDAHNIVAVDLPVTPPKTVGPDQAYQEAGMRLRRWLGEAVLEREHEAAIYAYEQQFTVDGAEHRRRGIFTALGLEQFGRHGGGIHRHELTFKSGTDDRLKLMQATKSQLSPVFGTFSDPGGEVVRMLADYFENRPPDFHGRTDHDGVTHRCWRISDPAVLQKLQAFFEPADVFIADGHHRYTTALNYQRELASEPVAGGGAQGGAGVAKGEAHEGDGGGCLFVLVAREDPGMIVLPTHRVLCGMQGFSMDQLIEAGKAENRFTIRPTDHGTEQLPQLERDLPHSGPHAMGLFDPSTRQTYILSTTSNDPLGELTPDRPEVWRKLDVAILEHLLVEKVLRLQFGAQNVFYQYPHELDEMVRAADEQPGRLGVVMQPTPLKSVCDVSLAGEVMPPKSTFFFPKLATGLVINPLD